jgi:hypothetical protein
MLEAEAVAGTMQLMIRVRNIEKIIKRLLIKRKKSLEKNTKKK